VVLRSAVFVAFLIEEEATQTLTTFCLREYTTAKRHLQQPLCAILF